MALYKSDAPITSTLPSAAAAAAMSGRSVFGRSPKAGFIVTFNWRARFRSLGYMELYMPGDALDFKKSKPPTGGDVTTTTTLWLGGGLPSNSVEYSSANEVASADRSFLLNFLAKFDKGSDGAFMNNALPRCCIAAGECLEKEAADAKRLSRTKIARKDTIRSTTASENARDDFYAR